MKVQATVYTKDEKTLQLRLLHRKTRHLLTQSDEWEISKLTLGQSIYLHFLGHTWVYIHNSSYDQIFYKAPYTVI